MKKIESLEGISDGRVYDIKDMVKVDTGGCEGCSDCCHGVGELVSLTPFDVFEITRALNLSFDELLNEKFSFYIKDKIRLPYLKMLGETEKCSFLNKENRCSIHGSRPNICRLFPLGRVYEEDDFKYFLQVGACTKPKLGKVKVKKWIGIDNYNVNKRFILEWYKFIKALEFRMKFIRDEQELNDTNNYLLDAFYRMNLDQEDFYSEFYKRLSLAKDKLGLI